MVRVSKKNFQYFFLPIEQIENFPCARENFTHKIYEKFPGPRDSRVVSTLTIKILEIFFDTVSTLNIRKLNILKIFLGARGNPIFSASSGRLPNPFFCILLRVTVLETLIQLNPKYLGPFISMMRTTILQ